MELTADRLILARELSKPERAVVAFTSIPDDEDVAYVVVSGYVAILTGRPRSTEDIDIVLERLSGTELERLSNRLDAEGYRGWRCHSTR
jgi:hypothetical protein